MLLKMTSSPLEINVKCSAETSTNASDTPLFSAEEEWLFRRHFDEGYDLHDEEYNFWLHINHPDACC